MTDLLLALAVTLALAAWNSGTVQRYVGASAKKLPKWAQAAPPLLLSSVALAAQWLVTGAEPTVDQASTTGFLAVGLYHVGKRIPVAWLARIVRAWKASLTLLLVSVGIGSAVLITPVGLALPVAVLLGCSRTAPVKTERAVNLAKSAIAVTDEALAQVIYSADDFEQYAQAVLALKSASQAVSKADATVADVCSALPTVGSVAAQVACEKCSELVAATREVVCR